MLVGRCAVVAAQLQTAHPKEFAEHLSTPRRAIKIASIMSKLICALLLSTAAALQPTQCFQCPATEIDSIHPCTPDAVYDDACRSDLCVKSTTLTPSSTRRSRRFVVAKLAPATLLAPLVAFADDDEAPPPPAEAVADAVEAVVVKVAEKMPTNARRKTGDGIMEMNAGGDGGYRRTCENFRTERLEGGVCVPRKK